MARGWLGAAAAAFVLLLESVTPAPAQEKIGVATTPNSEAMALFVAVEEGFFRSRGLDVEVTLIALNPTIPASLVSGSIQIGVPTPTVFGQAVDNGLDLVVIAGVSTITAGHRSAALIARRDLPVAEAKDLAGKTVAVPGLNALLHVALQMWFEKQAVPANTVRFVEVPIPQVGDLLKAGRIDAAIGVDPFLGRFEAQGASRHVASFLPDIAEGQQTMYYVSTREWAARHATTIGRFRAALEEAAAFIRADPDRARADLNKYMKLTPEVAKTIPLPETTTRVTGEQFAFWNGVMRKYGLITADLDAKALLAP